jgi:hypothetical protein
MPVSNPFFIESFIETKTKQAKNEGAQFLQSKNKNKGKRFVSPPKLLKTGRDVLKHRRRW